MFIRGDTIERSGGNIEEDSFPARFSFVQGIFRMRGASRPELAVIGMPESCPRCVKARNTSGCGSHRGYVLCTRSRVESRDAGSRPSHGVKCFDCFE